MNRRRSALIVVAVIASAIGILVWGVGLFSGVEQDSVDKRFSIRGPQEPNQKVTTVLIDAETFDQLNEQWPFPRSLHGNAIDRLRKAGAKVIAYDVQFTEPTIPREDNRLLSAVRRAGNVALATDAVYLNGTSDVFGGVETQKLYRATVGNSATRPDSDGVIRKFPTSIDGMLTFPVAAARLAGLDHASVPPRSWIDFAGPAGTVPAISFSDLLTGKFEPERFKDKTVVVGTSEPTLQDVSATAAGGGLMPGAEIQANEIATILDGFPLRSPSDPVVILLILLMGSIIPLAGWRLRPLPTALAALAIAALYLVAAQLLFNAGVVIPVVYPMTALVLGSLGTFQVMYLLLAFQRQQTRDRFSRFVPESVVEQVLADGSGDLKLGGVRTEATVLFSDIRNFTTYSESRPPEDVVEVLNHYLGLMTDTIMNHGGTLISYMGDGIMAVFGAPVAQPDHADRAISGAREMLNKSLPTFNEWMKQAGYGDGFRIGIGVNTGEVMLGQVGSERRMEYTTIGDTVNTAARLEGMTKGSGFEILVSETTREACTRTVSDLDEIGEREVRGRDEAIRLWGLRAVEEKTKGRDKEDSLVPFRLD